MSRINWYMVDNNRGDGWYDCMRADATDTSPEFIIWMSKEDGCCWGAWNPGQKLTEHYGLGYKNTGYAATAAQEWLDHRDAHPAVPR